MINILIVTEDELRAVGFYRGDDESDTVTISREQSVDWTEEVNNVSTELEMNVLADSIIGITDHDFDRLSELCVGRYQVCNRQQSASIT